MANPDELLLATFQLDMTSNQCGYPLCCPGTQVDSKIPYVRHYKPLLVYFHPIFHCGVYFMILFSPNLCMESLDAPTKDKIPSIKM